MQTAKGVPDMISTRIGSLSLLAGAMLLASAGAFANVEPTVPQPAKPVTTAKELQQAKTYTVSSAPTEALELAKPKLPDLSGYTAEAAAAKINRSKAGKISVRRMMQEDALKDFIGGYNKMAEWVVRQHAGDLRRRRLPEPQGPGEETAQAVLQRNLAGRVPGEVADRRRP